MLDQTYKDIELIIWDDASTDYSWQIIESYSDKRIRKYRNAENRWAVEGVNKAILDKAEGEYIAIHHSDDIWEAEKLRKQLDYMLEHPDIGAVFSDANIISDDGSRLKDESHPYYYAFKQQDRTRYEWLNYFFFHGNALCHPSVLIRRRCYQECGVYRYGLAQMPDFDMWVRLCMKYQIHVLTDKLVRFRVKSDESNTSANTQESRSRGFFEHHTLLKNYKKIQNKDEFVAVFPESSKYFVGDNMDIAFALSMILIGQGTTLAHKFLGMEMLFELIEDAKRAATIKDNFGIDHVSLIALTEEYGLPYLTVRQLEEEVFSRDMRLKHMENIQKENDAMRGELDRVYRSLSWRLTMPVRKFCNLVKKEG